MPELALNPKVLVCPADTRIPASGSSHLSNSNVSYFVSLDASDTNPNMFLIGDRNLTNGPLPANHRLVANTNYGVGWSSELHRYQGNIGLADGSVQQFSRSRLAEAFYGTQGTNRLAFP
ncbi:MAG TPA: hypothetical protein VKY92_14110 [Verrucomicrobiae bacterium]|nr:hypothetical protein [Verrucomicrobiae bacterium]